ncbi:putative type II secretion system protein E [Rubripirellula obstinata]|uniref:Putative type II secretion system protein E n=1 Tax=Rubripirellula obstinata TaxID=406547 RepID=A0A5B1CNS2_9BACT|nr:ATPase, T2SS/T4P/T4SS family [Rubripirellula obstinata]KAA1262186.1 putative type II secretion system protein E [Rubripirellula obstinata]
MSNVLNPTRAKQTSDPLIVRLLQSVTQLDPDRLEDLYNSPSKGEVSFEEMVIRSGVANERQIAEAYARHYLMPLFDPPSDTPPPVDPGVAEILPSRLCRDHLIAPLSDDGQTIEVAVFSPDSLLLADEVKLITGRQMRPLFTTLSVIERLLSVLYEEGSWTSSVSSSTAASFEEVDEQEDLDDEETAEATEIVHLDQAPPPGRDGRIIRYVNSIFEQALQSGASDIHIEPYEDNCRVRLRIDGSLTEVAPPPMQLLNSVISRLKVLSKMDIAERRLPQDGAIGLRSGEHRVDMRVNTCPTVYGEKIVMRVLDKNALPHDLSSLGLDERQFQDLSEAIRSPHGLMLVTGPTGSGKSTTLYSCLNYLNDSETNICTVEDPVEFKFAGINQVQTRSKVGLTFSSALRSFLRQDPDVIMVGEVRDNETADICMRAALTGHFVFSTLHTNDALSSITRLKDMGIESFLLSSTIRLLVAQRLLRRLCNECKTPTQLDAATAARYGIDPKTVVFKPAGCSRCRETGYRGRLAVFEIIRINTEIAEMIQAGATVEKMQKAAVADGMKLLKDSALEKVVSGETGLEEALSVCVH